MKKILMVGPSRKMQGGVATVVNSYYKVGMDKKVKIEYIETLVDGKKTKKINQFLKSITNILFRVKKSDIVHIHMASRGSFFRKSIVVLISKMFNKKTIIHMHGGEFMTFYNDECNKIFKLYVRYILNKSDHIIALSNSWKKNLSKIVTKEKITVLTNGVIIDKNQEKKSYKEKVILFLGRLEEKKGVFDLVEVIKEIVHEHRDSKFIIAGDGELEGIKNICSKYNLDENVNIVGWVEGIDKVELLKTATVYVLPSYNEGMPMSILEAMAYSIPVLSTYVGGIPEIIDNGIDGILIEAGDKIELKKSLLQILSSETDRMLIGQKGRKKIEQKFNLMNISDNLIGVYSDL